MPIRPKMTPPSPPISGDELTIHPSQLRFGVCPHGLLLRRAAQELHPDAPDTLAGDGAKTYGTKVHEQISITPTTLRKLYDLDLFPEGYTLQELAHISASPEKTLRQRFVWKDLAWPGQPGARVYLEGTPDVVLTHPELPPMVLEFKTGTLRAGDLFQVDAYRWLVSQKLKTVTLARVISNFRSFAKLTRHQIHSAGDNSLDAAQHDVAPRANTRAATSAGDHPWMASAPERQVDHFPNGMTAMELHPFTIALIANRAALSHPHFTNTDWLKKYSTHFAGKMMEQGVIAIDHPSHCQFCPGFPCNAIWTRLRNIWPEHGDAPACVDPLRLYLYTTWLRTHTHEIIKQKHQANTVDPAYGFNVVEEPTERFFPGVSLDEWRRAFVDLGLQEKTAWDAGSLSLPVIRKWLRRNDVPALENWVEQHTSKSIRLAVRVAP